MRPKSVATQSDKLTLRLYSVEKKAIQLAARKAGISTSAFVRKACLEKDLSAKLSDQEIAIYKTLVEYRNNFARISNLIKNRADFTAELKDVTRLIDTHLKKLTS